MIIKNNKAIFSDFTTRENLRFNYIDVGARGDIVSPWLELGEKCKVIGFEPDSVESKRLNDKYKNRKYYDIGLWSTKTLRKVYINKIESTSSMYLPNMDIITKFESRHWLGRELKKIIEVECDQLDSLLKKDAIIPDFIKIDTQGAELEILKGARGILEEFCPIVTCETWCLEVYKDAPKMHEVVGFMDSLGYQIFNMEIAASWKNKNNRGVSISSKSKSIGYEVIFIKRSEYINLVDKNAYVRFLLLLELFGYRDFAIFLLETEKSEFNLKAELIQIFYSNNKREQSFCARFFNKIHKMYKGKDLYPSIKF